MKSGVYFDGSNTTNRILDVLQERRPKIICIDELDKMSRQLQCQLLSFMESGRVKVDPQKKQYDFQIKGAKIFATANEINRLSIHRTAIHRCVSQSPKNLSDSLARFVGKSVWDQKGDVRDVLSIGKLVRKSDGPEQIELIIKTMTKYGSEGK